LCWRRIENEIPNKKKEISNSLEEHTNKKAAPVSRNDFFILKSLSFGEGFRVRRG